MELRYVYLVNEKGRPVTEGHINLAPNTRTVSERVLCGENFKDAMTTETKFSIRKTRIAGEDVCQACLEKFKQPAHPEAVAYRKAFERV